MSAENCHQNDRTNSRQRKTRTTNDEITVTGQCNETGWYCFEYNGQTAYVFADYVGDNKVEVAQPSSGGGSSLLSADGTTITLNGTDYPVRTWIDLENLFIYFEPSLNLPFEDDRAPILNSRDKGAFGCDQCYTLVDRGYTIGMMSANWMENQKI